MKYTTAKEFMQALPKSMYVDLDTANMRSNSQISSDIVIGNYVADRDLVQKVTSKILKADDDRMNNLADMRDDNYDDVLIDDIADKVLSKFMSSDCNVIVIHETLNFFDNAIMYDGMDACYVANNIANRLKLAMQVNNVRVVYKTPENIGNDIFYIITTSIDAVTTINTLAAEKFVNTEGNMSSFYEALMHIEWCSYSLEDIVNDDILCDMDAEKGGAWTNYGTKHYTSADMKVDQVVNRFCRYIALLAYSDVRFYILKHFKPAYQNYKLLHSVLRLPDDDNMKAKAEADTHLYPDLRWVFKQFRKRAYLDGTGKEIAACLQKIYDTISAVSININIFVSSTEYISNEFITADEEKLDELVADARWEIFDDLYYYDVDPDDEDEDDDDYDDD